MTAPFSDADSVEVCARVFYQWVRLCNRQMTGPAEPATIIGHAMSSLPRGMPITFTLCAGSMLYYCGRRKMRSRVWLDRVIMRDRMGWGTRYAVYWEYKAGRRDPRVTNRGVRD